MNEIVFPILVGVIVVIIGQGFTRLLIETIRDQQIEISRIADSLSFYSNIYSNVPKVKFEQKVLDEISGVFRAHASVFQAKTVTIKAYNTLASLNLVPAQTVVSEVIRKLLIMSIMVGLKIENMKLNSGEELVEHAKEIRTLLKIQLPQAESQEMKKSTFKEA